VATMFLSPIHSFRAIAIIFIVAGHVIWAFSWHQHPDVRDFLADFFENGTVLFVFVSGFLFQHLSARFDYRDFLSKKFRNVVLPYLIISTPAVLYTLLRDHPTTTYPQLDHTSSVYQALWLYTKGGAHINYPLWFIPMITVYFLLAPAFMILVRHPRLYWLLVLMIPTSLIAHRPPFPNLDLLHLCVYYLSAYVTGMFCSQFQGRIEPMLNRYAWLLAAFYMLAFLAHFHWSRFHGNYEVSHIFSTEKGLIDWTFALKLVLCFTLWAVMSRLDRHVAPHLRYLADASFAIFFVHMYFIFSIHVAERWHTVEGGLLPWFVELISVLVCSVFCVWAARKLLGHKSRLVIGS
jgi:hypothetical protein